jgi:hypothetical protein
MTLDTVLVGALLGAAFFLALLLFLFYRKRNNNPTPTTVSVPLKVDRSALLTGQRERVADYRQRRAQIATPNPAQSNVSSPKPNVPASPSEAVGDGFGEDLGAAMAAPPHPAKPKRNSRFAALQDAADQFKDMYNRNNQL